MTAIMKPMKNTASNAPSVMIMYRDMSASVTKTHIVSRTIHSTTRPQSGTYLENPPTLSMTNFSLIICLQPQSVADMSISEQFSNVDDFFDGV